MTKKIICILSFILSLNALEVDILDSFNLKDGKNGIQATTSCKVDNGFYFGRTSKNIIAVDTVLREVVDLLTSHKSFIVSFKNRPEPYHKGSIIWLEQKNTATPLFGLWMRSGKSGRYGLQFYGTKGVEYVTLEDPNRYDEAEWHHATLHFYREKKERFVSLYVNCKLIDTKKANIAIKNGPKDDLELRLGQREIAGKIFSKFKGSLSNFRFIFQRNISTYLQPHRCETPSDRSFAPRAELPFKNIPFKPTTTQTSDFKLPSSTSSILSSLTANEISSIFKNLENSNNDSPTSSKLIREILAVVKDVRTKQENQVFELKSLKELLQILGTKHENTIVLNFTTQCGCLMTSKILDGLDIIEKNGKESTNESEHDLCASSPCYPFVSCTPRGKTFRCGKCPVGLEGNGINCTDINECKENPCSSVSKCENKLPGYICHSCPKGYRGDEVVGIGLDFARLKKQECIDINECSEDLHSCDKNAECINTAGGFKCGNCNQGYKKDQHGNCLHVEMCKGDSGKNPCSVYATCEHSMSGTHCKCRAAKAGDGYVCGNDQDGDGYPDKNLDCKDVHCKKDNCPFVPNSGQEDTDNDGKGDACDSDIDNDKVYNVLDNCPFVGNKAQTNSDSDEYGDDCDNCMFVFNPGQEDADKDGQGDVCDRDIDGDGVLNFIDNCKTVANPDQMDRDKDGTGDVCDNCPDRYNPKQENVDDDEYGDECDNDIDSDKDGHIDKFDNCPYQANADQLDTDADGKGDVCDDDDDGDDILDKNDNCPLIANPVQSDFDGDSIGDLCQDDEDGDSSMDDDNCPKNKHIHNTDFRLHHVVLLGIMDRQAQKSPKWIVNDQGREVSQERNAAPSIILSDERYSGFDFTGSVFVNTQNDDDFIGFAFGFQSVRKFYLLSWKQKEQSYWRSKPSLLSTAQPGIQLKYVESATGQSFDLRAAIWHSGNVSGQVTELWRDKEGRGWEDKVPYHWQLMHRPSIGMIRLKVFRYSAVMLDTGYIIHGEIQGGRLGPYAFSQASMVWSNMRIMCNEDLPDDILMAIKPKT